MSRHTRALIAGTATAAAYYAAAALRSQRPVRLGGLLVLSLTAFAGAVAQGNRASAKAYEVEGRLNQFFNGGGQVGGTLFVNGDHHVSGDHYVSGQSHTHLTAPAGFGNVQVQGGSGVGLIGGGNIDLNGGSLSNTANIHAPPTGGINLTSRVDIIGGNLHMNGSNIECTSEGGAYH